ncbi:MAG: hypothetical protein U0838_03485 [Chloroflexota bacterium]
MDDVTACAVPYSQSVDQTQIDIETQVAAATGVDFIDLDRLGLP